MYDVFLKLGKVVKIIERSSEITIIDVQIRDGGHSQAINYPELTGQININDTVLLNTTAVELNLGTGGFHFVWTNLGLIDELDPVQAGILNQIESKLPAKNNQLNGHIMKLRYTPFQIRTLSVEEKESPYHQQIKNFTDLAGYPVVIIPLHSLLAPLTIVFKKLNPEKKVVYIMTEGGSLALRFSNLVRELKSLGYLDLTITAGHAFGGDIEAVNIFTALAAAREIARGDLIIVGMGPGIVGTGTKFGFSGIENVFVNNAVDSLQGKSIFVPRLSLADSRQRHYGLSHHTITILRDLINNRVDLVLPENRLIKKQLIENQLVDKHNAFFYQTKEILNILRNSNFDFHSMGRGLEDDPLFFSTAGIAVYRLNDYC